MHDLDLHLDLHRHLFTHLQPRNLQSAMSRFGQPEMEDIVEMEGIVG